MTEEVCVGAYFLGLATLPALALLGAITVLAVSAVRWLLEPQGHDGPDRCRWGCRQVISRPGWTEPRLTYAPRRRRAFARHMRESEPCRERCNRWRLAYGDGKQW